MSHLRHSSVVERLVANEKVEVDPLWFAPFYEYFSTKLFQKYVYSKDIRKFKKIFFIIFFLELLDQNYNKIRVKIYNFEIMANYKKKLMSFLS